MTKYERKREQIASIIKRWHEDTVDSYHHLADQILSLVEIKSDDQSLPEIDSSDDFIIDGLMQSTQQDMLIPDSEGRVWVRVIPKPKGK